MRFSKVLAAISLAALLATSLSAQSIYGTFTGIVSDPTGAVVAKASIKLRDQQSGSQRETVTNSDGFYTFISVPPGTYQLTVVNSGFETYKQSDMALTGGDKLNANVVLKLGNTANVVEVSATVDILVPADSGENSNKLTSKEMENFIQIGSNAAEFLKIMPGFAISNGTSNSAAYDGQTMGINGNGGGGNQSPLNGAYSYNGLPALSLDITADGAHVSDPGCNCATPVNPNTAMISEIKVNMSNFTAENQKGPGVISSVAKGGGSKYHGSFFFDARNAAMNANDWLSNYSKVAKPENKYYYPGFTFGGPVIIPGTRFNRNRDKLFFFTGYQYFYQVLDTGLLRSTVPTAGMRNGDFSPAELTKLGNITAAGIPPGQINAKNLVQFPGGIIPPSRIDPNMQNLMKNYPLPNADPNSNSGYNWVDDRSFNQNGPQWMSRVDYSISDNTKLFVRYNMQREVQLFPIGLWSNAKTQALPYPTPIQGKNGSDSISASLTHVFNPTMTNEFVFGYTYIAFPNIFSDTSKVDRAKVGYTYKGLFKNGVAQIPNLAAAGEVASIGTNGGFEIGGPVRGLYADKFMPSISDSVSKLYGKHTFKVGVFWERIRNTQPASANTQGSLSFNVGNSNTLGNPYADMLVGNLNSYTEASFNRVNDISYTTFEGYVQDSWKVSKRLTVDLGIRITHFTPWTDNLGFGFSVFDPSKYKPTCAPIEYCGFLWNKRDPSVPVGGFPTKGANYQPRVGMAYDLFGNGKTVLRGGWGRYIYHSGQFTTGLNVSAGVQQVTLTNNQGPGNTPLQASQLDGLGFSVSALSIGAVDRTDDRNPVTDSYSFTISQRVPGSGLLEIAYVGNQTRDIANSSGAGSDLNVVPVGAMLSSRNNGVDPNSLTANNFRPLIGISDINLATHNLYANYNSMQAKYMRTKGRAVININYTFGKALGILNPALDTFNLRNDYGVQANNRTHIFNAAYSYSFPKLVRNKAAGVLLNGWQLSGITQLQSGANLTGQRGQNFGMALNSAKITGTTFNVSSNSILGTPNITLTPILTCDPRKNLGEHQFLNPSCFSYPKSVGEYQATTLPVIYGPAYFNADLGLFKNFTMNKERTKIQIRANAYNFLNHPLWSFNGSNLNLSFSGAGVMNAPLFGTVNTKQGHRVVQLAIKVNF